MHPAQRKKEEKCNVKLFERHYSSTTGNLSTSSAITNNGQLAFNRTNTITQGTDFASVITGTGTLTQAGTGGTLILNGTNTYTGTTTVSAGTLQIGNGSTTGSLSTSSAIRIASTTANLTINRSNAVAQGTDFSSAGISGTGNFIQAGNGTTTLNAANTYTGGTTISGGILNLGVGQSGSGGPLGGSGTVATVGTILFTGGTLQFSAANTTDYSSRFSESSGMAYRIDANGQTVAWGTARVPTGTGSLTKLGTGTLNISTSGNGWTGATTLSGGTLNVNTLAAVNTNSSIGKGSAGGSAADLVFDSGTLQYTGSAAQTTDRLFTVTANGGSIDASGSNNANPLTFTATGALGASGTGARTLTLTGSNTGANSLAGILVDPSSGATSLTKSDAGKWVLSGINTVTVQVV